MAICTNPLRASVFEKPRQTKRVCQRFSQPLSSQCLGTSHPYKLLNLGSTFLKSWIPFADKHEKWKEFLYVSKITWNFDRMFVLGV